MSELPWERNPEPPDEPCVNPACERSVYFPDEPSFWAVAWMPDRGWEQPVMLRACSLRCLALAIAAQAGGSVEIRWADAEIRWADG